MEHEQSPDSNRVSFLDPETLVEALAWAEAEGQEQLLDRLARYIWTDLLEEEPDQSAAVYQQLFEHREPRLRTIAALGLPYLANVNGDAAADLWVAAILDEREESTDVRRAAMEKFDEAAGAGRISSALAIRIIGSVRAGARSAPPDE